MSSVRQRRQPSASPCIMGQSFIKYILARAAHALINYSVIISINQDD